MKFSKEELLKQLTSFIKDVAKDDRHSVLKKMQQSIDYLQEKIRIYEEILCDAQGQGVPQLSDQQKRRLSHMGRQLDQFSLSSVELTFSPETIRSWYRKLEGIKYDSSSVRPENKKGPKPINDEIIKTILRIANSNTDGDISA